MKSEIMASYGLTPVARFRINADDFEIEITDSSKVLLERCIYAFVIADEIVRVGSSKASLRKRLGEWRRDVSRALHGQASGTPLSEAQGWRDVCASGEGIIYARAGTIVTTPVGEISAYLDEEITLIQRHRPRFCKR